MNQDVELGCRCGEIHGWVHGVSPSGVNRAICYCDDCQAYLHHLGRSDLLDANGGTDVVQVPPNTVTYDRGTERIAGLRLTPKGLYRWYASCCKTPLGNTLTPVLPFIGMPLEVLRGAPDQQRRDELFGKVRAASFSKSAIGTIPDGLPNAQWKHLAHALWIMLGWKLKGKVWPHPFFERETRAPRYPIKVLSQQERDELRPKCGPHPTEPAQG